MLNLSSCLSREKFYSIRLRIRQRLKPKSFQFLLLRLPASNDVTQSGFWSRNLKKKDFTNLREFQPSFKSSFCIFRVRYFRISQCVDCRFSLKSLVVQQCATLVFSVSESETIFKVFLIGFQIQPVLGFLQIFACAFLEQYQTIWTVSGLKILDQVIVFSCLSTSWVQRCTTPAISVLESGMGNYAYWVLKHANSIFV